MGFAQLKKQADQANIVANHPHLVHKITDPLPEHVVTVQAAKIIAALGQEEASRLAAEKAEAERVAKEAEEARIAKEAEDALSNAGCSVLDETDVKANTKFVLKSVYNAWKHNQVHTKALQIQEAIKTNQDLQPLVDDFLTSNSKSFINTVSGFGTIVVPLWPDTLEKEGCLQATGNPTGNGDYCKYTPISKKAPYNKDSVQQFLDTKLLSKNAQGEFKALDDAKQNYCNAFNLFKAATDGNNCVKLVVEGYCKTTDTVNAAAHDVLCDTNFNWAFDGTVC